MKYLILLLLLSTNINAQELKSEDDYVKVFCRGYPGDSNPLDDGTRPDCIWDKYAVEYDWASFKWYECITQAKWYAMNTGLVPACVLIVKSNNDWKYVNRAERLILHYKESVILFALYKGKFTQITY